MRKPASLMIAIGLPRADEPQDEDSLNREQDDGEGDIAEQIVMHLVECLSERGPGAVARVRQFAQALEAMADACMERDHAGLEDAAADTHKQLSKIFND
jgi:hypothetical protein